MQSVGNILRNSRLAQGRTIEQVNSSTRISVKHLEAIEADEVTQFSSAFFYKSFVRQFAEDLKLNFADLVSAVQQTAGQIPEPRIPGQGGAGVPKVAALPVSRRSSHRWVLSLVSFGLALAVCSTIYAKWQTSRFHLRDLWPNAATVERGAVSPARDPAAKGGSPSAGESLDSAAKPGIAEGVDPGAQLSPDPIGNGFTLQVSATEPTWLSIFADGKRSFTGTLEAAESKTLEGRETARIRTGNAGGVSVVFNGKLLGALGPRGQIRTVLFTRDSYEVLDAPAAMALTSFSPTGGRMQVRVQPAVLHLF